MVRNLHERIEKSLVSPVITPASVWSLGWGCFTGDRRGKIKEQDKSGTEGKWVGGYYLQNTANKPRDSFSLVLDRRVAINVSCETPVRPEYYKLQAHASACVVELQSVTAKL